MSVDRDSSLGEPHGHAAAAVTHKVRDRTSATYPNHVCMHTPVRNDHVERGSPGRCVGTTATTSASFSMPSPMMDTMLESAEVDKTPRLYSAQALLSRRQRVETTKEYAQENKGYKEKDKSVSGAGRTCVERIEAAHIDDVRASREVHACRLDYDAPPEWNALLHDQHKAALVDAPMLVVVVGREGNAPCAPCASPSIGRSDGDTNQAALRSDLVKEEEEEENERTESHTDTGTLHTSAARCAARHRPLCDAPAHRAAVSSARPEAVCDAQQNAAHMTEHAPTRSAQGHTRASGDPCAHMLPHSMRPPIPPPHPPTQGFEHAGSCAYGNKRHRDEVMHSCERRSDMNSTCVQHVQENGLVHDERVVCSSAETSAARRVGDGRENVAPALACASYDSLSLHKWALVSDARQTNLTWSARTETNDTQTRSGSRASVAPAASIAVGEDYYFTVYSHSHSLPTSLQSRGFCDSHVGGGEEERRNRVAPTLALGRVVALYNSAEKGRSQKKSV